MANTIRSSYKLNSLVTLLLMLSAAILICWVSLRFEVQFDWTRNSRHSLSQAGISILQQIEGPIRVTAYAREDANLRDAIRRYISKYQAIKPDISLLFINPDSSPELVREMGIRINGELVFEYGERIEHVRAADEDTIINALVRLWRGEERWLASVTGHGERSLLGRANHDLGEFGNYLTERGYKIQPLNLAEIQTIPDNTSVLMLAGPRLPLLDGELQIIIEYLRSGGNFLWLVDPDEVNSASKLTEFFPVEIGDGTIIDVAGRLVGIDDPTITMITSSLYGPHPSVAEFEFTTLFPKAAALMTIDNDNWSTISILTTGDHTWLEKSPLDGEIQFDEQTDIQGPLTLGLALTRNVEPEDTDTATHPQQRAIIIGDGDFLSNTYLGNAGNLDLGVRLIDWISYDEKLVDIPVRSATDTQLTLSSIIIGSLGVLFLIFMPVLFCSAGFYIWWRRRRA